MQRTQQILFAIVAIATCWFGMLVLHEMGHVVGAFLSGGTVERIVLYPLTISSTHVSPNPNPGLVVWLGPVWGATFPLVVAWLCPARSIWRKLAVFFAGFCLIANGAYIGIGSIDQIGDCKEMANTGTSAAVMIAFGIVCVPSGFYLWHRLGSIRNYFDSQNQIPSIVTISIAVFLILMLTVEFLFSPSQ